jgi:HAMP domain-containing protein
MRLSEKLSGLCAAATTLPLIAISFLTVNWVSSNLEEAAREQLQRDARAAASLHKKRLDELRSAAQRLGDDIANRALVSSERAERESATAWARLQDMLPDAQNELGLDFLIVTDAQGRVIARHNDRPAPGESVLAGEDRNPIAEKVISEGNQLRNSPTAATLVERGMRLEQLGLKNLARVEKDDGSILEEALMLEAGAPIFSARRFVGMVLVGQMLNNYSRARAGALSLQTPLVAEAHLTLYPSAGPDRGAMIALGNTIVASSVPGPESSTDSALKGKRCNQAGAEETLTHRDNSYRATWQAIKSLDGVEVGAIGVAASWSALRRPAATLRTMLVIITVLACLAAGLTGFFVGRSLGLRVDALADAAGRMSLGELSAAIKDPGLPEAGSLLHLLVRDEIARLAGNLEQARQSFRQAIDRLRKR